MLDHGIFTVSHLSPWSIQYYINNSIYTVYTQYSHAIVKSWGGFKNLPKVLEQDLHDSKSWHSSPPSPDQDTVSFRLYCIKGYLVSWRSIVAGSASELVSGGLLRRAHLPWLRTVTIPATGGINGILRKRRVNYYSHFQIQDAHLFLPLDVSAPCSLSCRLRLGSSLLGSQELALAFPSAEALDLNYLSQLLISLVL